MTNGNGQGKVRATRSARPPAPAPQKEAQAGACDRRRAGPPWQAALPAKEGATGAIAAQRPRRAPVRA